MPCCRTRSTATQQAGIVLINGGNNNQPAPVLTDALLSAGGTMIDGTLGVKADTSYIVQYFVNNPASNQGRTLLGSQPVPAQSTNGIVNLPSFTVTSMYPPVRRSRRSRASREPRRVTQSGIGRYLTVLQRRPLGQPVRRDQHQRQRDRLAPPSDPDCQHSPRPDAITFSIPGSGVQTISPASPLPTITDPVIIDGYSQPGASPNTLAVGNNAGCSSN